MDINSNNSSLTPPFPDAGSTIGPDNKYFCLGRLGKGTFCSIHKCVDLSYAHCSNGEAAAPDSKKSPKKQRIVAAKAELASFLDSGVIDGEASVLRFLDASLPMGMVPTFVDYVRQPSTTTLQNINNTTRNMSGVDLLASAAAAASAAQGGTASGTSQTEAGGISAIIMEYLPGEDMHLLRDRHCQIIKETEKASENNGEKIPKRVSVEDAVYLVADVMLPLLKAMHEVGMVHRDVKPSNVVRCGTNHADKSFKIVDFGLSKSFVVPKDSSFADPNRPWKGKWMSPSFSKGDSSKNNIEGCIRQERESAEFRGTSMYASLRVHQGKDHCPRDDIWGLLYVFCDLVTGGLPWMSHAAARDRSSCQIIKEMVVGERGKDDWSGKGESEGKKEGMAGNPNPDLIPKNGEDAMEWLLYGSEYHMAKYKRDIKVEGSSDPDSLPPLPEPLGLAKNEHFVACLRKAFRHVASLGFVEMPDYDLIGQCLKGFITDTPDDAPPIDWNERMSTSKRRRSTATVITATETGGVAWELLDQEDADPLEVDTLVEAENERRAGLEATAEAAGDTSLLDPGASLSGEAADLARLPLQMQFCLSQAEYNARNPKSIPIHVALRDWMALALQLANSKWDAAAWERGNHRTDDDGYRNEVYLSMLQKCLKAAEPFNCFAERECYYYPTQENEEQRKRRRIETSSTPLLVNEDAESPLVVVSRVFFSLRLAVDMERGKNFAPPPKLSFGFGR